MPDIPQFFSLFAFAQMFTCALFLLPAWRSSQSVRLFTVLMGCGCAYVLGDIEPATTVYSLLWWLEYIAGNALIGVFWLMSISVFTEQPLLHRWHYAIASLTLMIPLLATISQLLFHYQLTDYPPFYGLVTYGAMLLELVLIGHALVTAISQWRNDLVEDRRYIRGGVITFAGFYIFYVIVSEQLFKIQAPAVEHVKYVLLSIIMTGINFLLFRLRDNSLFATVSRNERPQPGTSATSTELNAILAAMVKDKLYQQDGLTIAQLARQLGIHEYKLRQLINGELQYRNFNDFLNFYRIQEVTQKLTQAEISSTPILTLALESGFRSLSSFNKAFKDKHGITPTAYRKKVLTES